MRSTEQKNNRKSIGIKIARYTKTILFITMLIFIFIVSPRVTELIRNIAKYLYEIDPTDITRVVELILSTSFVSTVAIIKNSKEK